MTESERERDFDHKFFFLYFEIFDRWEGILDVEGGEAEIGGIWTVG